MDQNRRQFIGTVISSLVAIPSISSLSLSSEVEPEMFSYWNGKEQVSVQVQEILDRYQVAAEEFFFHASYSVDGSTVIYNRFDEFINNLYNVFQCHRPEYHTFWVPKGKDYECHRKVEGLPFSALSELEGEFYSVCKERVDKIHQEAKEKASSIPKDRILTQEINEQHRSNINQARSEFSR